MFKKIVVAIDGSEHAAKALALAIDLGKAYDAELALISVPAHGPVPNELRRFLEVEHLTPEHRPAAGIDRYNRGGLAVLTDEPSAEDDERDWAILADQMLSRAKQEALDSGVERIRCFVEVGDPAKVILDCAKREKADLIALGSRGLGDLEGLLLGSVSHKVCQLAGCACITLK